MEARYGKPRGQGYDGEWFAFRQLSDDSDLSLRLYANRCRTGMYSIIYTDNKAHQGPLQDEADTAPATDKSATDKMSEKPAQSQQVQIRN